MDIALAFSLFIRFYLYGLTWARGDTGTTASAQIKIYLWCGRLTNAKRESNGPRFTGVFTALAPNTLLG